MDAEEDPKCGDAQETTMEAGDASDADAPMLDESESAPNVLDQDQDEGESDDAALKDGEGDIEGTEEEDTEQILNEEGTEDEHYAQDGDGEEVGDEDEAPMEHDEEDKEEDEPEPPELELEGDPGGLEGEGDEEGDEESGLSETNNNNESSEQEQEAVTKRKRSASAGSGEEEPQRKQGRSGSINANEKHDRYCWVCHRESIQARCKICPRSYHFKCMHLPDEKSGQSQAAEQAFCICPECAIVMDAENTETRSDAMKQLTIDELIAMLKHACQRMQSLPGVDAFLYPVDPEEAVDYFKFVKYPMDLCTLEENVKNRQYGSTEAFLSDAQWLVHNSIIFNSASSPFTTTAKRILKTCKQEIQEIETCPECYVNAHQKPDSWFTESCKRPHVLVWAKLKGFPFWPAKAMRIKDDLVDVRFFGQHDRAWVVRNSCFLYSEEMPGVPPKRNSPFYAALEELNVHIEKLKENHGPIKNAPVRNPIGPELSVEQIREMLPEYQPEESAKASSNITPTKTVTAAVQQESTAKAKSPMTIRISSLKTNPTIVTNTVFEESADSSPNRPILRIRKSTIPTSTSDKPKAGVDGSGSSAVDNEESKKLDEKSESPQDNDVDSSATGKTPAVHSSSSVPSQGILASVLGANPTRRISRTEIPTSDEAATPTMERRLTRSAHKSTSSTNESGDETSEQHAPGQVQHPNLPDSFLAQIGLHKAGEMKSKPVSSPFGRLLHPSQVFIKEEAGGDDEGDGETETSRSGVGTKAKELMHQMSGTGKPGSGMRFNLSKDISISPVGEDSDARQEIRPRRPIMQGQGQNARLIPGLIPQNMQMGGRPRPNLNVNGGGMSRAPGQGQQQGRLIPRPQQRPGGPHPQQMRPMGMKMPGHRLPGQQMHMKQQQQQGMKRDPNVVDSSSQGGYSNTNVQLNQVQSLQGAITLPGGTITVTPLQPVIGVPITTYSHGDGTVNGGQIVTLKQGIATTSVSSANGLPISVITSNDGNNQSLLKSNNKTSNQRRNLMNQVPSSVGHIVQNLQKNLVESVKTTMEQIVVEMLEHAPNAASGPEMKALKDDNDKLRKQMLDQKHNHDIALRELKVSMENEKKRTLNEQRRQMEQDKFKAVEETKKKQWCARCGREAQFYCCWNTSYCGYSCQEEHWPAHMNSCSQSSANAGARN